jgi:hypothetical protein
MIELDVYPAGLRDFNKILALDHQLEAIAGLRYKFGNNHDLAISSSINPRSASVKFAPFSLSSASIHDSSAPFRRNFGRKQKRNR